MNTSKIRARILLVEDDALIRFLCFETLTELGHVVHESCDGLDALRMLEAIHENGEHIDLIITDINMPEMNGIELIRYIRGDERFQNILIIVLSAPPIEEKHRSELARLGVSDYLEKPPRSTELAAHAARAINLR